MEATRDREGELTRAINHREDRTMKPTSTLNLIATAIVCGLAVITAQAQTAPAKMKMTTEKSSSW
jgi:hypothetical protein